MTKDELVRVMKNEGLRIADKVGLSYHNDSLWSAIADAIMARWPALPPFVDVLAEAAEAYIADVEDELNGYPERIDYKVGHIKEALAEYRKAKKERP